LELQHINMELKRAHEDPPARDPQFQEELQEFAKLLRLSGVAYSQQGDSTPEFLVALSPDRLNFRDDSHGLVSAASRAQHPRDNVR
jgi:hypothetical protein